MKPSATHWLCLLGALAFFHCEGRGGELPGTATIVAKIAPGKPGAPTESIEIAKREATCTLTAKRVDTYGKEVAAETAQLSPDTFAAIWRLLEQNGLPDLQLQTIATKGADFGERSIRMEWNPSGKTGAAKVKELTWTSALAPDSEKKTQAFLTHLSHLAAQHLPKLPLSYFPSN